MGKTKVGTVVIDIEAGTAKFLIDLEKANGRLKDFGAEGESSGRKLGAGLKDHAIPQMSAASAAIRTLEGNFQNNIRAAERFLSTTLGLSGVLEKAFPVVGAVAFAGVVYKMGEEGYDALARLVEGGAKARSAFGDLTASTRLQNDALQISIDNLDNEIAKLSGKPGNGLKLALDEAIESSDKLFASLLKAGEQSLKVLKENGVGRVEGVFRGIPSTVELEKFQGGLSGFGGQQERLRKIQEDTRASIEAINGNSKLGDAEKTKQVNLVNLEGYKKAKAELETTVKEIRRLKDIALAPVTIPGTQLGGPGVKARTFVPTSNRTSEIADFEESEAQERIRNLAKIYEQGTKQQTASKLRANAANAELGRPYGDALDRLDAKIKGLGIELRAVTDTEENQVLAKGMKAAYEEITKVNDALKKVHSQLTDTQKAEITAREVQVAQSEAYLKFGQQVEGEIAKTKERITAQNLLTAAIGKGYEATKRAAVEAALAQRFGDKYGDRSFGIEVGKARTQEIAEFEAKHKQQIQTAIDGIKNQTQLEHALIAVQGQGKDAIDRVTFAYKLRELYANHASSAEITAAAALFETQRGLAAQSTLTGIQDATTDAKALAAAWLESAAAAREAALAIRIRKIGEDLGDKAGPSQAAARTEADQKHREEVERAALGSAIAARDQLAALKEQQAYLQSAKVTDENRASIAISLKQNLLEQNKIVREQVLQVGTLKDGFHQFWKDLGEESESAASKMYNSMKQALSGINDELAKFFSGAKTNWKQLGQSLAQSQIKQQLERLEKLGSSGGLKDQLGKVILGQRGINGQTVGGVIDKKNGSLAKILKRDGNTEETALYVIPVQSGGGIFSLPQIRPSVPGDGFASAPGSINNFYLGTDPAMVERRLSSTVATGQATAISQSVQAVIELGKRIPK